jgi:phytoene dehydrogenase-like protein
VAGISVAGGRARGVVLEDGSSLEARVILSSADPRRSLLGLVGEAHLPGDVARSLGALDFRSPVAKIHLALAGLPRFRGGRSAGVGPEHVGTIHVGSLDLDALERSFEAASRGEIPERPMLELTLASALDPGLAPEGRQLASLFVQHVPHAPAGGTWDGLRERLLARVLALLDEVAPGFSALVEASEVLAPPDLERLFGMTGGNIFHGAMTPDRLLFARPLPGWARYRTPLAGLYLCGAGTHPGGGVMGACGRNAALEVVRDLRRG